MYKISKLAKGHVWMSRFLIIFLIYPLLNLTGWFLGDMMDAGGWHISWASGYLISFAVLILFLVYPDKKNAKGNSYVFRKACDVMLATCTFLFILLTGNHFNSIEFNGSVARANETVSVTKLSGRPVVRPDARKQKKSMRKWIQSLRKKYRDADQGTKVLLSILAVLLAIGLILLLGGLACSVACNGSEGLAYVIFFLGTAGIIYALVKLIGRIHKGPKKKETVTEPVKG